MDWSRYRIIYIARVHTDYLMQANWWQQNFRADQMQHDVANTAFFMRTQFIKAFQNDLNRRPGEIIKPASTFSLMPW